MDLGLEGRTVLVTGGTGGIGSAIVRGFAAEGARVAVAYHSDDRGAEKIVDEIGGPDRALAVRHDIADPADTAVAGVARRWGAVDVLVANAVRVGARRPPGAPFEETPDDWPGFLADNLAGTIRTVGQVLPGMRERGWGRIVLISSRVASRGKPGREIYGATKAGLHGFANSLVWDVGRSGILVNVVCPGLTLTDQISAALPDAVRERELAVTPTGRLSVPTDVSTVTLFLCSATNCNITGQVFTVSGGR